MQRLTTSLTLASDASIDLHMHTTYSDGRWPAEQLINYLVTEKFDLVAVTDHDRVDTVAHIQQLAVQQNLPVLAGVEMSTEWHGKMGHVLCYGFDPDNNDIRGVAESVVRRQLENTHQVYDTLRSKGYEFYSMLADMAETVDAAHRSGAVCLIAHPGRQEHGFTFYDPDLLDQVRAEIPLDGIEVYHPYHRPEMVETYLEYVRKHNLLLSTGSDSHSLPGRMPIKHRAEISRQLLERVGIQVL